LVPTVVYALLEVCEEYSDKTVSTLALHVLLGGWKVVFKQDFPVELACVGTTLGDRLLHRRQLLLLETKERGGVLDHRAYVVLVRHHVVNQAPDVVVYESVLWQSFSQRLSEIRCSFVDVFLVGNQEI
jgi:hypothetical protein